MQLATKKKKNKKQRRHNKMMSVTGGFLCEIHDSIFTVLWRVRLDDVTRRSADAPRNKRSGLQNTWKTQSGEDYRGEPCVVLIKTNDFFWGGGTKVDKP